MTRILHLIETGGIGGAEMVYLQIARGVNSSEFEMCNVLMRTGWLSRKLDSSGIKYLHIPSTRRMDLGFTAKLGAVAAKHDIEILHAHLPDANAYASVTGMRAGIKVMATYHGLLGSSRTLSQRAKLMIVRRTAQLSVAVSTTLRQQLIDKAGFPADKVSVIHNGVDWTSFDQPYDTNAMRSELGLKLDSRVVGMVGNMRPAKGYPVFVKSAQLVLQESPNTEFLIVGEEDAVIAKELRSLAERSGVSDRLHYAGARDDVAAVLGVMDVFALSSLSEGMSIATVEAMGAGVPVVVTRCGGPEDLVDHQRSGLVVEPGDPQALATGILRLLQNGDLAEKMAEAGRRDARNRFDVTAMVNSYEAQYKRLAGVAI